jgi:hypothetical protein
MTPWQEQAMCAGDSRFTSTDPYDQAEAIAICQDCPVIDACLAWAKTEDFEGVAAGRLWRGKKQTGNPANRPAPKYGHWSEPDMREANRRHAAGDRQPWTVEGHMAYKAWRKRVMRKSRAA